MSATSLGDRPMNEQGRTGNTEVDRRWHTRLRRVGRRAAIGVAILLALVSLWIAITPEGRVAWRTALFIPQVVGSLPVNPQPWVMGEPTREEVFYEISTGLGSADLYTPAGDDVTSGVLLFLGVNPAGRNDPRVVGLAEGLARSGAVVLIPWSEGMTSQRVIPEEVEDLVRGFEYLLTHERVDPERAGVGGFCVGASLVAVAASDPRIRDDVSFVNFFAGYYDARDLIAAVLSNSRYYEGVVEPWTPAELSKSVVTAQLIEGMENPAEIELLKSVFVDKDAAIEPSSLSSLSQEAQTVHRLLSGVDVAEAQALINSLPDSTLESLASISPITTVDDLRARVLIMHDREDRLVPAAESRRLADALAERGDVRHTEFSLFQHLDPTKPVGPAEYVRELSKLYRHMYMVMDELR